MNGSSSVPRTLIETTMSSLPDLAVADQVERGCVERRHVVAQLAAA